MPRDIQSRPTPWTAILLLCGKCARKLDGGYGAKGKDTLRDVLRRALRETGRRRDIRVIETRCMGICPKQSVVAVNAGHPGRICVVPARTPAADVLRVLVEQSGQNTGDRPPLPVTGAAPCGTAGG